MLEIAHRVEIGAGRGACTFALARRGVEVIALERDPHWAEHLRREVRRQGLQRVSVVCCDALRYRMPDRPFRAMGSQVLRWRSESRPRT